MLKIMKRNKKRKRDIWTNYRYNDADIMEMNNKISKYYKSERNSKRRKIENFNTNEDNMLGWVSATKTKYYLLNDTCLDWLILYYDKYGITPEKSESGDVHKKNPSNLDILFDGGNIFEKKIYENLQEKYKDNFRLIFDDNCFEIFNKNHSVDGIIREKYLMTIDLMKKAVPIIAQAVMINDNNKTYGIADLLIRSDYFSKIFKKFHIDDEINTRATKLGYDKKQNYHYRVVDCKWSTFTLCVDGITIRNEGRIPAYKGQLAVYTAALEKMQGYIPNYAYIMAKTWKLTRPESLESSKSVIYKDYSAFNRLGVI